MSLTQLENELLEIVQKVADNYRKNYSKEKGNKFITPKIMEAFNEKGENLGYIFRPQPYKSEFLYDIVWLERNPKGNISKVALALESELGYGWDKEIKQDFEKLLLTNAALRVMICFHHPHSLEELKSYATEAFDDYNLLQKGDRLLMLIWDDMGSGKVFPHLLVK